MTSSDDLQHRERMTALVEFTSTSLATEFPSPFGSSIYDLQSGELVVQTYDTVIELSVPTNHAEMLL